MLMFSHTLCSLGILGLSTAVVPPPNLPSEWLVDYLNADLLFSPTDSSVNPSTLPEIGNGFLATQLMTESIWVSGLFNGYLTETPSHRARIPATNAISAPGTESSAALHIRNATYLRRSFIDPSGGTCSLTSTNSCSNAASQIIIEQRWYAHRALPSLMVMELQILPTSSSTNPPDATLFAMLKLTNHPGSISTDINFTTINTAANSPYSIVNGSTLVAETNSSSLQAVSVITTNLPTSGLLPIDISNPFATQYFFTVIRTTIETAPEDLIEAALSDYDAAEGLAISGTLHSTHVAEWASTIWTVGYSTDRFDVAQVVNSSIYAILSSVRSDRPYGLSPGGLTAGYNGHSFWDCETWMFPSINFIHPDISDSLLQYRVNRIPGAQAKALSYSPPFSGTMFPWESALTGSETCPSWAATGLREIHISGDIAFAIWQFWRANQDNSNGWLNETGFPLLSGIAQFWMSKLAIDNPSSSPGSPLNLLNVIPPDEYADHVNNSAYTNSVAIYSLQYAAAAAALLGEPPSSYAPWIDAASRIVIPFDSVNQYHPEYDGYKNGTVIKQADVILLGFPLEVSSSTPEVRANDLLYYSKVTDNGGPAMTWGMFAVSYLELGPSFIDLARSNFNRSFANAQPPFLVWTETPSGGTPNFLTGAGGFLQTALFGYSGIRVNDSSLTIDPHASAELTSIISVNGAAYLGNRLNLSLNFSGSGSITIMIQSAEEDPSRIDAAGIPPSVFQRNPSLSLAPRLPLSKRSQRGQVVLRNGNVVISSKDLEVVEANGQVTALTPGTPARFALTKLSIRATS